MRSIISLLKKLIKPVSLIILVGLFAALLPVPFSPPPAARAAATIDVSQIRNNLGLIGWWTFDGKDMPLGYVLDKSGQANNGNMVNMSTSTAYVAGKIGQALLFDGIDDSVSAGSDFVGTGTDTITAWIKPKSFGEGGLGRIVDNGNTSLRVSSTNNVIQFSSDNFTTTAASANNAVTTNSWLFVAVTRTATGAANIYINGVRSGTADQGSGTPAAGSTNVIVGNISAGSATFDGLLDDVRVYNRALSAAEVLRLYNLGATTKIGVSLPPPSSSLDDGLVGWWTFDGKDMPLGYVLDKSGQVNNGNMVNMATSTAYVAGKIGQALKFDGSNDRVSAGSALNLTGAITVSAWVNSNLSAGNDFIVGRGNTAGGATNQQQYFLNYSAAKTLEFQISNGTVTLFSAIATNRAPDRNWYHVVGTYNGSDTTELYVNGARVDTDTTASFGALNQATIGFGIGDRETGSTSAYEGTIDDVRVYNRALSAAEILRLYNLGATTKIGVSLPPPSSSLDDGLVGWWTFDGKDMPKGLVLDKSGQANNGNMVSMSTSTAYVAGKIGQALSFDGVDDSVSASSDFVGTGADTITVWITPKGFGEGGLGRIVDNGNTSLRVSSTNNVVQFSSDNFTTTAASANNAVTTNSWLFVAVTRTATGAANIYINGVRSGTADQGSGTPAAGSTNVIVGNISAGSATFDGLLDDVRVYNRALSAAEVLRLYNLGR